MFVSKFDRKGEDFMFKKLAVGVIAVALVSPFFPVSADAAIKECNKLEREGLPVATSTKSVTCYEIYDKKSQIDTTYTFGDGNYYGKLKLTKTEETSLGNYKATYQGKVYMQ